MVYHSFMPRIKTKKYELSRSAIVNRLEIIIDQLREINTAEASPNDVANDINVLIGDVEQLQKDVTDEEF